MKVPKNFLWGASTSAYQVEGSVSANGKGKSVQDLTKSKDDVCDFSVASDHYNNYKEDIKLMAEMGFKSYRFSISWTRIFPDGNGKINNEGIEFYNNLINELKKYKIEPIVTIYHFDTPLKLHEQGGWSNRELMVNAFVKYSSTLFDHFGDRVKYWLTINEQNMMIMFGHVLGLTKLEKGVDPLKDLLQQNHHMMVAQAMVIDLYKTKYSPKQNGKIGPAPNIVSVYSKDCDPKNIDAAYKANSIRNWLYLDCIAKGGYNKLAWNWMEKNGYTPQVLPKDLTLFKKVRADFIAFNYYSSMTVEADETDKLNIEGSDQQVSFNMPGEYKVFNNEFLPKTQFGWSIDPEGFLHTCRALNDRYGLPIIITENGLGAYDKLENGKVHDQYRIDFLREHIKYIPQILSEGIELFGFNPWSAIDLVSTHEGIKKRYGFIFVDKNDQEEGSLKRYKKDSFYWYKDVIASNGEKL